MIVNCLGLLRKFFISSILKLSYVIQKLKKKLIYTSYILEFLTDIKLCGINGKNWHVHTCEIKQFIQYKIIHILGMKSK